MQSKTSRGSEWTLDVEHLPEGAWLAKVREFPGVEAKAKSLPEAEAAARSLADQRAAGMTQRGGGTSSNNKLVKQVAVGVAVAFLFIVVIANNIEKRRAADAASARSASAASVPTKPALPVATAPATWSQATWLNRIRGVETSRSALPMKEMLKDYFGQDRFFYDDTTVGSFEYATRIGVPNAWRYVFDPKKVSEKDLAPTLGLRLFYKAGIVRWSRIMSGPFDGAFLMRTAGTLEVVSKAEFCHAVKDDSFVEFRTECP